MTRPASDCLRYLAVFLVAAAAASGQQPPSAPAAAAPAALTIQSGTKAESIPAEAFAKLPHKTLTVFNAHSKMSETYSGLPLNDLLARVDAPLGGQLHGKALATYIVAQGSDGYRAVYSLAEVDPAFHGGEEIVADTLGGKPLGKDGPYKLVNTEDKRPARWVRNLVLIVVTSAQ